MAAAGSSADATVGGAATSAAPAPTKAVIEGFTLYYHAPGGCYQSDRMRDTYLWFCDRLVAAGTKVTKLERVYDYDNFKLLVSPAGSTKKYLVWSYDKSSWTGTGQICADPWYSADKTLIPWAATGVVPDTAKEVE